MMRLLIIATGNPHKTEEFAQLLRAEAFEVESATICGGMPAVDECGSTFSENAMLKAQALRELAPEDAWVLADDSGLEVDALDGAPGIYSARYAGTNATDHENVRKLLSELANHSGRKRRARFRCSLCLMDHQGGVHYFEGSCEGQISERPSGASGFGYDPVFIPSGYTQSFADLGEQLKAELSHRARAVQNMRNSLTQKFIKGQLPRASEKDV